MLLRASGRERLRKKMPSFSPSSGSSTTWTYEGTREPIGTAQAAATSRQAAAARSGRRRQNPGTWSSLPAVDAALDSQRTRLAAAAARESAGAAPSPRRGARPASMQGRCKRCCGNR